MCDCKVCSDHRRWYAALNPQTEDAKAVFEELMTRIEGAETDAAISQARLDGKWAGYEQFAPSASSNTGKSP